MSPSRSWVCGAACAACLTFLSAGLGMAEAGRPNGQAIQFGIDRNFTLTDFGGITLSYQRFVGRDAAWRISADISLRYDRGDYSEVYVGDGVADEAVDQTEWTHRLSVASEWLWYRGSTVSVFFGGGPLVSFSSFQDEEPYYYPSDDIWRRYRYSGHEFAAGLRGCIGVQWAASRWLAVHAEYGAQFEYLHRVDRSSRTITGEDGFFEETTDTVDEVSLVPTGVRFGLSAYF